MSKKAAMSNGNDAATSQRDPRTREAYRITVVSAGISDPSTTGRLGDAVALKAAGFLRAHGDEVRVDRIDLRDMAQDIAIASVSGHISPALHHAIDKVKTSDGLVAATPIFKATYSGLFKSFWDVTDPDVVLDMPVALTATGGSDRHALVPDTDMRSLFAFLRAMTVPTSVVAATADWASDALASREGRAGAELGALIMIHAQSAMLHAAGAHYRRTFDAVANHDDAEFSQGASDVDSEGEHGSAAAQGLDFDSALMRLAAGGVLGALSDTSDVVSQSNPSDGEQSMDAIPRLPNASVSLRLNPEQHE